MKDNHEFDLKATCTCNPNERGGYSGFDDENRCNTCGKLVAILEINHVRNEDGYEYWEIDGFEVEIREIHKLAITVAKEKGWQYAYDVITEEFGLDHDVTMNEVWSMYDNIVRKRIR